MSTSFAYDLELGSATLSQRSDAARSLIVDWLRTDALGRLAEMWSKEKAPRDPMAALEWWERTSAAFDYRSSAEYRERWHADSDPSLESGQRAQVQAIATNLGLVGHTPPSQSDYSSLIVLGAGRMSPLFRTRYAAKLVRHRHVSVGSVYLLGSIRPLDHTPPSADEASEFELTRGYAPSATTEYGLMLAAAQSEFDLADADVLAVSSANPDCDPPKPFSQWRVVSHRRAAEPAVHVLCARRFTRDPGRPASRPNTADTYAFLSRLAEPHAGESALVVTTQLFVPFQAFDAFRMLSLPYGVSVDVVGFPDSPDDRQLTAEALLQEIRSAFRSAKRLWDEAQTVAV